MFDMILTAIGLIIGGFLAFIELKEDKHGKIIIILNILVTMSIYIKYHYNIGLIFSGISLLTFILSAMFLTRKDGTRAVTGEEMQRAFYEKEAAKARANPRLAMINTINRDIRENAPSSTTFFNQQQKESDAFTQQRLNTIGDIRAGRTENGTDGIWL